MVQALYSHSLPLGWPWKEVVEGVPCNAASYRVLTWWCLLVSFRIVRKVTGGRRELSQSVFGGTQAISRPEAVAHCGLCSRCICCLPSCLRTAAIICC